MHAQTNTLRRAFYLSVAVAAALGGQSAFASAVDLAAGRVLVKMDASVSETQVAEVLKANMSREIGRIDALDIRILSVPAGFEASLVETLGADSRVAFAEVDRAWEPREYVPNDTYYSYAWQLPQIGATYAWDNGMGEGVTVAVLDSGVDATHADLAANMVAGWNAVDDSSDTSDITGHGTKVAGLIGALTDNALGVPGVAGGVSLMPVRITNETSGYAYSSDIVAGLIWAADNGARVANISYAMTTDGSISAAAAYMRSLGGVVVMPSGNDGVYSGASDNPNIITVAATDATDATPSWSTYGPLVDLAAPGVNVPTTNPGNGYTLATGTSFSAPIAAGVAALVVAANPELSAEEIEQILEDSADDIGAVGFDDYSGYGRVNADAAVQLALAWDPEPIDEEAPVVSIDSPAASALVSGTISVALSATDNVAVTSVELYADGALIGSLTEAPYAIDLDTTAYANGALELVAYAYDAAGNQAMSAAVSVSVDNFVGDIIAPVAQITSPAENSRQRSTADITAIATDDTAVVSMTLWMDAIGGEQICTGSSDTLTCSYNFRNLPRGYHTIYLVAEDAAGNQGIDDVRIRR